MSDEILKEQIAYYRARAQEYDRSLRAADSTAPDSGQTHDLLAGDLAPAAHLLKQQGPFREALELACGTGIWTQVLLTIAEHVTALDAAPEMLAIARDKLGSDRIDYMQADLFHWQPDKQYDLVFFAFWLSHVPPDLLDPFLNNVARAVRPGGSLIIIDQFAPTDADRQVAREESYAERPLSDGRTFKIVKVFYDLDLLREKLAPRGFTVDAQLLGPSFFFLSARQS
jgi:demethylmenaquinone methyltransferase/2-methoxy-6-polyprenyl-1,4-benzoquinol methylase